MFLFLTYFYDINYNLSLYLKRKFPWHGRKVCNVNECYVRCTNGMKFLNRTLKNVHCKYYRGKKIMTLSRVIYVRTSYKCIVGRRGLDMGFGIAECCNASLQFLRNLTSTILFSWFISLFSNSKNNDDGHIFYFALYTTYLRLDHNFGTDLKPFALDLSQFFVTFFSVQTF